MKIQVISLVALIMMPVYPGLCERAQIGAGAAARWFGGTAAELASESVAGGPLKIRARFVRKLTDKGALRRRGKSSGGGLSFLVVAEGGEVRCEMGDKARGADALRGMKRATPVVIRGTLDARRNVFMVDSIVQGWGRDQLGDNS
jgi:hypothetical protein